MASNIPVLLFLIIKLLPCLVFLASKPAFYARREGLIMCSETGKNFLIFLGAVRVLPLSLPAPALITLYKLRADLVIFGLIRPLLQHMRWRMHLVLVALEAATMPWLLSWVVPSWVAGHAQVRGQLRAVHSNYWTTVVSAVLDVCARRQFVRRHCRAAQRGSLVPGAKLQKLE